MRMDTPATLPAQHEFFSAWAELIDDPTFPRIIHAVAGLVR